MHHGAGQISKHACRQGRSARRQAPQCQNHAFSGVGAFSEFCCHGIDAIDKPNFAHQRRHDNSAVFQTSNAANSHRRFEGIGSDWWQRHSIKSHRP